MKYDNPKYPKESKKLSVEGRVPPQAIDMEQAVLGALLSEKNAIDRVLDILSVDSFYKEANQLVFQAIFDLFKNSSPVDLFTVIAQLQKMGKLEVVGGAYYLTQLTDRVVGTAHLEYHARIIAEKYIQRELISSSLDIIDSCYSGTEDVLDIITKGEKKRDSLLNVMVTKKEVTNLNLFDETLDRIIKTKYSDSGISGVPSGLAELDKITGGFQASELIIIAARPAMGKSALAMTIAKNAAINNKIPVALFNLEMSNTQSMYRFMSMESEIELFKFKKHLLNAYEIERLKHARTSYGQAPIVWDDTAALSFTEFRAKARKLVREHGIQMIILDYLQLMQGEKSGNRENEIASISRGLKMVAKELDIPVIALSQLSRSVESRPGNSKRPLLSDLRESGAIEQDADMVMFLYRPEYYGIQEDEEGRPTAGVAEVIIAKNRSGETDDVEVRFVGKYTKFMNLYESYNDDEADREYFDMAKHRMKNVNGDDEFNYPTDFTNNVENSDDAPF